MESNDIRSNGLDALNEPGLSGFGFASMVVWTPPSFFWGRVGRMKLGDGTNKPFKLVDL